MGRLSLTDGTFNISFQDVWDVLVGRLGRLSLSDGTFGTFSGSFQDVVGTLSGR